MADAWVVNASPLIALAHADKLELLEKLPTGLVIPEAVVVEILFVGRRSCTGRVLSGLSPMRWLIAAAIAPARYGTDDLTPRR